MSTQQRKMNVTLGSQRHLDPIYKNILHIHKQLHIYVHTYRYMHLYKDIHTYAHIHGRTHTRTHNMHMLLYL